MMVNFLVPLCCHLFYVYPCIVYFTNGLGSFPRCFIPCIYWLECILLMGFHCCISLYVILALFIGIHFSDVISYLSASVFCILHYMNLNMYCIYFVFICIWTLIWMHFFDVISYFSASVFLYLALIWILTCFVFILYLFAFEHWFECNFLMWFHISLHQYFVSCIYLNLNIYCIFL